MVLAAVVFAAATGCSSGGGGGGGVSPAGFTITSPTDNSLVSHKQTVRGTAGQLASDQTLWLVVYAPLVRLYYPQPPRISVDSSGDWTAEAYFGEAGDVGKVFYLYLITADAGATAAIEANVAASEASGNWQGMPKLPAVSLRQAKVTVIRQ